jgi:CelD/BcsL family acetyltransferase involved in cellulose biosynthesis
MNSNTALALWDSAATEASMTAEIRFEFVETSDAFRALETEWAALGARTTGYGFFQRFAWQWRIWQHVASVRGRQLRILVGRSAGRTVLIWPLMRDGRQLRLLSSDKGEYRDLLVEDGPHAKGWMAAAWATISRAKGVDLLLFQDVRSDSNLGRLLKAGDKTGWKHDRLSRVIRLNRYKGWDDYAATLSKSTMKNQRKQWRRIASGGVPARFEVLTSEQQVREGLDWLFRHKLAWLKTHGISDITFGSPEFVAFMHAVILEASQSGHLYFSRLRVGDETVVAGLGYRAGSEFAAHMFTYDVAWQSYSPGRLWLENVIRWCFDNGVSVFDLMPGEESYKALWADDGFWVTDYLIPITLRGMAIIRWHASGLSEQVEKGWLRAVYRCLPRGVQQRINAALLAHREYAGRMERL